MPIGYIVGRVKGGVNHFWCVPWLRNARWRHSLSFTLLTIRPFDSPIARILKRLFFFLLRALHICIRFVNAIYDSRASLSRARCGWKCFLTFSRAAKAVATTDTNSLVPGWASVETAKDVDKNLPLLCVFFVVVVVADAKRSRDNFPLSWFLSRQIWWPHSKSLIQTALRSFTSSWCVCVWSSNHFFCHF